MVERKTISNIEWKLKEADFFLGKMREVEDHKIHPYDFLAYNFYFNSFTVAGRSVTLAVQYVMCDVPGFPEWYVTWQERLRRDPLARRLLEYRNEILHKGEFFVRAGAMQRIEDGVRTRHYFGDSYNINDTSTDVYSLSKQYMVLLVDLVRDLQRRFAKDVDLLDPDQFYTLENLRDKGYSINDLEEGLGYPRGWTHTQGATEEERLQALLREIPRPQLQDLYDKYLRA